MLSDEYMSRQSLELQLSLCPGGTYTFSRLTALATVLPSEHDTFDTAPSLPPRKNIVWGRRQSPQSVCQSTQGLGQSTQCVQRCLKAWGVNFVGTYEEDIEVRRVGQATPELRIFCNGWKREARQDVGVGVLRSMLYRKSVRIQEFNPSLYTIALVRQSCKILKR